MSPEGQKWVPEMTQKTICAQLSWQLFDKQSQSAFHPTLLEGLMTAAGVQIIIFTATLMLAYHMGWVNSRSSLLSLSSSFLGETFKQPHGIGSMRRRPWKFWNFKKAGLLGCSPLELSGISDQLFSRFPEMLLTPPDKLSDPLTQGRVEISQ